MLAIDPLALFADKLDPPSSPYVTMPADWVRDKLEDHLTVAQDEIISAVIEHRHVAVPSAHDLGKSWGAARLAGWWIDTHPPGEALVVTTAPTWTQVAGILWQEIAQAHRTGKLPGRITSMCEWKVDQRNADLQKGGGWNHQRDTMSTLVGLGKKPADYSPTAFQGYHRRYVLVLIDEACGIAKNIWDAVESIATNEHARIVALGNPDDPSSFFAEVCKPGSGWKVIPLDALKSPNFTEERVRPHPDLYRYMIEHHIPFSEEEIPDRIRDLLVSPTWAAERLKRWGASAPMFTSKVRGRFPVVTIDTLIHPHWVTLAQARELPELHTDPRMGVDVARYGTDHSIIVLRLGGVCRVVKDIPYGPITELAGVVQQIGNGRPLTPIANVDDVGVGGGVTDILREESYPCLPLVSGGSCSPDEVLPNGKPQFYDARSEWWWNAREALAGLSGTGEDGWIDLDPEDDDLAAQLTQMKYGINRHGQIWVETKDSMRKRGLPSPDRGDAFVYSLVKTPPPAIPRMGDMITGDLLLKAM